MLGQTKLDLENVLAFVAGVMTTVAFWELYPEAWKANDEELRHRQQQYNVDTTAAPLTCKTILHKLLLQNEYRPILWGTMVGTALMVATELYLPWNKQHNNNNIGTAMGISSFRTAEPRWQTQDLVVVYNTAYLRPLQNVLATEP